MEIEEILELGKTDPAAAKAAYASLVQTSVTAASGTLSEEITKLKDRVETSESKKNEIWDENKPVRRMKAVLGIEEGDEGHDEFTKLLEDFKTSKDSPKTPGSELTQADVDARARILAQEISEQNKPITEAKIKTAKDERDKLARKLDSAIQSRDHQETKTLVNMATTAEGAPKAKSGRMKEHLVDFVKNFEHWEDGPDGKRVCNLRDGNVPIMNAEGTGPATHKDLIGFMAEGKGDQNWNKGTRDYFLSSGTGHGSEAAGADVGSVAVTAEQLGKTKTLTEFREAKEKTNLRLAS